MISRTQENFLWGALIGGALAATVALFLTPFSGKEVRKNMLHGLHNMQKNGHDLFSSSKRKTPPDHEVSSKKSGSSHPAKRSRLSHQPVHALKAHRAKRPKKNKDLGGTA